MTKQKAEGHLRSSEADTCWRQRGRKINGTPLRILSKPNGSTAEFCYHLPAVKLASSSFHGSSETVFLHTPTSEACQLDHSSSYGSSETVFLHTLTSEAGHAAPAPMKVQGLSSFIHQSVKLAQA
ncbi:hypothetical protein BaRGS_00036996 [Batillaria attramentaria]|uniref:Uncharacterized protein n=1 Tax=Batillaria attramentaria TaxID=370345 RepID=A0ABD0JA70_9CAEN